jgi:hypothetical protein
MTTTPKRSNRLVAALVVAPAVVLAGCTNVQDSESVDQERPLEVSSPVELFDAERLFTYGQPTLSEHGTGSGTYDLPEPLTTGQTLMVTASCAGAGAETVSIETDAGFLGMEGSCSNSTGASAEKPVEFVVQDREVTVNAGDDNAYWLNVFVVDPTEPAPGEPASPEEQILQEWSVETVAPKAEEIYRWVETLTEPATETVEITPGTYRWAASCRNGNDVNFIVTIDDEPNSTTFPCDGPGPMEIHEVFSIEEPTTVEFTADVGVETDMTFALARQR